MIIPEMASVTVYMSIVGTLTLIAVYALNLDKILEERAR